MSLEMITQSITEYGLIAIFVIIMLEYACLPLPSEVVLPFSGAIAAQGKISFVAILGISIAAGLLGSLICYFLGYVGGSPLLDKLSQKYPKMKKGIEASKAKYEKYAALSVGVGRLIPLCRTYISFVAGIAKQDLKVYTLASIIGISCWNTILVGAGYVFSNQWESIANYYGEYKKLLIPVALLLAALVLAVKWGVFSSTKKRRL